MSEEAEAPRDWVRAQLEEAEVPKDARLPVWHLLNQWWVSMQHPEHSEHADLVLDTFVKLAKNQNLVASRSTGEVWVPVKPGQITVRDRVRVRYDSYRGEVGRAHNGRSGTVIGIRNGDIIVKYTDQKEPTPEAVHHSPHVLEKRLR